MRVTIDTTGDPAEAHAIRRAVFIDEQGIAERFELDGSDPGCTHWLLREDGRAVATLRTKRAGRAVKIGRVATLAEARGRGHAGRLMAAAEDWARAEGLREARLSAQEAVIPWYARRGYVAEGPFYDDAGIPHRDMVLTL